MCVGVCMYLDKWKDEVLACVSTNVTHGCSILLSFMYLFLLLMNGLDKELFMPVVKLMIRMRDK